MEEIQTIPDKLKYDSYKTIRDHYESLYPCIGSKVWSILSLVPVSLILPKLIINNREIRMHLNFMWLSPSGTAKSSTAREFEKIAYFPLSTKRMSIPRLYHELIKRKGEKISLIVEDVAVWFMDDEKIKFLEGTTGEEESLSHETMRNIKDEDKHVDLVSFCSGTPENIANQRIKEGILRRFSPLIVYLSPEEHKKIINYINNNVGKFNGNEDSKTIKCFYEELWKIQEGTHKEISPITGFIFSDDLKKEANEFMEKITESIHKRFAVSCATETEELWRFAVCYAFLNIFKKKREGMIEDSHLIIEKEDLEVSKRLMAREISTKSIIMQCIESIDYYNIQTRKQLMEWEDRRRRSGKNELPKEAKYVMVSNVK